MGCCNKQRAAGVRIAGPLQPSLRQRLSAFFWGGGLISPQEYGLLPPMLHSIGGLRFRRWLPTEPPLGNGLNQAISQNRYPAISPTECKNHLRNPPCPQQHQEYACKLSTHALPTCYCFRRQAIKHQGTRHRESCGSPIMLRLQFSSGTAHAPSLPQSPYSSLRRRGGSALN